MSDPDHPVAPPLSTPSAEGLTAGQMLRQARQARGLHIAALATSIKVLPRKLEALEADRYDELPDATFTRALAQTVCRSLKIDPAPVLAQLPKASGMQLDSLGLNTPFRDRQAHPSRKDAGKKNAEGGAGLQPQVWLPLLLVFGAVVLYFAPEDFQSWRSLQALRSGGGAMVPTDPAVPVLTQVDPPRTVVLASEPVPPTAASAAAAAAVADPAASAPAASLLELRVAQDAWIEVLDGASKPVLARIVRSQEVVTLNASLPMRLKIGNASQVAVRFRGQPVDLAPLARDNVARIELK